MAHFTDKEVEPWKVREEARQGPDLRSNPPCRPLLCAKVLVSEPAPQLGPTERLHSTVVKGTNARWPPEPQPTRRHERVALVSPWSCGNKWVRTVSTHDGPVGVSR